MNSAAVEMLLQDVENRLSNYNMLLDEAYKAIDEKPVTEEEVREFCGYKPKSRELIEAVRIGIKSRDKYQAKNDLYITLGIDQGADLLRYMEREAEDTIFEDGGASEAKAIAVAIGRHIEAFNMMAPARARELYMKYSQIQRIDNNEQQQRPKGRKGKDGEILGVSDIADYLGMANSTCHTALKNGDIPGTWQDGSRWKLSIKEYEQSKYKQSKYKQSKYKQSKYKKL